MINNKFNIGNFVYIPNVGDKAIGRIIAIWIQSERIEYKVRYFFQGKAEEVYFLEDELENK